MGIEDFVVRFLPIVSNLAFLPAAYEALQWGYGPDAVLWLLVALLFSPSYHLCMGFDACLWAVEKHRIADFWSAEMAIPVVALYFIGFRARFIRTWIFLLSIVAIGLLVTGTDSSFMDQVGRLSHLWAGPPLV